MVKLRYGAVLWGCVALVGITALNRCFPSAGSVLTRVVIIPDTQSRSIGIAMVLETRNIQRAKSMEGNPCQSPASLRNAPAAAGVTAGFCGYGVQA